MPHPDRHRPAAPDSPPGGVSQPYGRLVSTRDDWLERVASIRRWLRGGARRLEPLVGRSLHAIRTVMWEQAEKAVDVHTREPPPPADAANDYRTASFAGESPERVGGGVQQWGHLVRAQPQLLPIVRRLRFGADRHRVCRLSFEAGICPRGGRALARRAARGRSRASRPRSMRPPPTAPDRHSTRIVAAASRDGAARQRGAAAIPRAPARSARGALHLFRRSSASESLPADEASGSSSRTPQAWKSP